MYSLDPQTPPDDFSEEKGVMRCPNSTIITVQVFNQSVYYQVIIAPRPTDLRSDAWEPSTGAYLGPGIWTFDGDDWNTSGQHGGVGHAIRFRAAIRFANLDPSTLAAVVTAHA